MRISFVLAVTVVFALLSASAYCANNNWCWGINVGSNYQSSGTGGAFGVNPTASDGYDVADKTIVPGSRAYFGIYHESSITGWNGSNGFYCVDMISPIDLSIGSSATWLFYVWADPTLLPDAPYISISCLPGLVSPSNLDVWLKLKSKPESVSGGPDIGTAWHVSETTGMGCRLPVYRTDNGLTGYQFELTATVIPEPASLLALASGVFGLGCFTKKRR